MDTNQILTLIGLAITVIAGRALIRGLVDRPKRARWWSSLDRRWQAIFKATIGIKREPTAKELVAILSREPTAKGLVAILSLTSLNCSAKRLTNLEPLRALTGLQELNCDKNQLTRLEPLHGLKRLRELRCFNNPSLSKRELERFKKAVPSCEVEI